MISMLPILADSGISAENVGIIIAGLVTALITGGVINSKVQRVKVDSGHMDVTMREKFLTRSEFLEFKTENKSDVLKMISMYDKAITLINTRDERLTEKLDHLGTQLHTRITAVVDDASERRRRIHDKTEEQGKQIAAIEARTDVSKAIGQLGKAIIANSKNS